MTPFARRAPSETISIRDFPDVRCLCPIQPQITRNRPHAATIGSRTRSGGRAPVFGRRLALRRARRCRSTSSADSARSKASNRGPEQDEAWNRTVTLVIVPNPKPNAHQRRVTAREYGMDARQRLRLPVREAVLFYVKRRFGLGEGHEARPPREQHIVLAPGR